MVISFLKNLFSGDSGSEQDENRPQTSPSAGGEASVEGFVSYVVKGLVDNPDGVNITMVDSDRTATIQVACDKKDIGKIIGKKGKTIAAIRALANGAAGRLGQKVNVEVLD